MRFASLGSGSEGNALVVALPDTDLAWSAGRGDAGGFLLVDCGFNLKETARRLARLPGGTAPFGA